jgi:hypothetical protein
MNRVNGVRSFIDMSESGRVSRVCSISEMIRLSEDSSMSRVSSSAR